jgi:hypothetical protein
MRMLPLGFVGLGVMGEPMCRNLAAKSGTPVVALDLDPAPIRRLAADGVRAADSLASLARAADVVFLSLPGGAEVAAVGDALLPHLRTGSCLVDLSTAPVKLARDLAGACAARGIEFADAPVARTRAAAAQGTLSIMVGAPAATFARIRPLLACMGSDVSHCGGPGAGQLAKLMNNMVLAQNVVALAEALAVARADPREELRPPLAAAAARLIDALEGERKAALARARDELARLSGRTYAPLRALREVLAELL